ncbi:unnamed protein product, partial [Phaeothamnion confervicola]
AWRSIRGFREIITTLGRFGIGPNSEVRRPDAVGPHIAAAADNHWFDAAVVPPGAAPPPARKRSGATKGSDESAPTDSIAADAPGTPALPEPVMSPLATVAG